MKSVISAILCLLCLPLGVLAFTIHYPEGYTPYYNEESAAALAKLAWAEGRGIASDTEKAAIMWCAINRVERKGYWADNLMGVLRQPNQFAYSPKAPVDPHLYELAKDVLIRWDMERCGYQNVGRVLPLNYCYFTGDGRRNHFRPEFGSRVRWNWSLPSPYQS